MTYILKSFLPVLLFAQMVTAGAWQQKDAAEIQLALNKLNVLGSALYIAAHPDDENTAVLSWLSKGKMVRAAYLSVTRGDGGQNLLGPEKGALLGVLRTQELLAARRIDGAEQFFTRAIDFGYSKSPDETMQFWDHDKILSDMVWVIRKFRPDIILTRFSENQGGHGHHLASAILTKEAFYAAADPAMFPEQLDNVKPWQVKRMLWNTWRPDFENRDPNEPPVISVDLGMYNPLLGKSYAELAAQSRTMHKTQGFGSSPVRGSYVNYFEHTAGEAAASELFDGIDLSWQRVEGGDQIQAQVNEVIHEFDPNNPAEITGKLIELYRTLISLPGTYWIAQKQAEVKELILQCSGVWIEAVADKFTVSPGDSLKITARVLNRSGKPIRLIKMSLEITKHETDFDQLLNTNQPAEQEFNLRIPNDAAFSQPYWLQQKPGFGIYHVNNLQLIGKPENDPAVNVTFQFNIDGEFIAYSIPAAYRWNDATKGEQSRPLNITPLLSIESNQDVLIFENNAPKKFSFAIHSNHTGLSGNAILKLPEGWMANPAGFNFEMNDNQRTISFESEILPPADASRGELSISVESSSKKYRATIENIEYDHIPAQTVLMPVRTELVRLNLNRVNEAVGYIMGTGDEIPAALEQVGYRVDLLTADDLGNTDLSEYDAIICGIRAYNALPELQSLQHILIDYVEQGGTWIVQHNTRFGFRTDHIGPVPFEIGRDRISDETAELAPVSPDDPLLNFPNKITKQDFDGWVQERGLYFASEWDPRFKMVLTGHDPEESPKEGSLIYAQYGKGIFIYTGLSFFRQLPAGVPGAYRLFVNLISAGKANGK